MGLSFNIGSTDSGNTARSLWRDKKCLPNFGVNNFMESIDTINFWENLMCG